jgi:glyoxylase-like metal-dependent hydrolase (beta-lactamase superfamily II)
MHRERISENVYWFQSEVYAQVTAGVIAGPQWAVVIDTLALPDETLGMREYIEHELGVPVRYVIDTHYHADHAWGNCFFAGATVIAHALCRTFLEERGIPSLEAARRQNPSFRQVKVVLPHLTFNSGQLSLRVGKKNLTLMPAGGHSADGISVLVEEDRVLFAGDAFMPIPYVVDGDIDEIIASIKKIGRMGLENIVQGHGDIILRGEIDAAVRENLQYLANLKKVAKAAARRKGLEYPVEGARLEDSGKSRVYLGGLAEALHERNIEELIKRAREA